MYKLQIGGYKILLCTTCISYKLVVLLAVTPTGKSGHQPHYTPDYKSADQVSYCFIIW